jgi:hypothetical protein
MLEDGPRDINGPMLISFGKRMRTVRQALG